MFKLGNLCALAAIFVLGPAGASPPSTVAIKACANVSDDKERLACFDREVSLLAADDTKKDAGLSKLPPTLPPKLTAEQKLGLPQSRVDKLEMPADVHPAAITSLTAHVAGVTLDAAGREVFALDNGQAWKQTETKSISVREGDLVQITRGSLGSFFLEGNHVSTRVSRIH